MKTTTYSETRVRQTHYTTIENLLRDRITYCAKSTDWQQHYWNMALEEGEDDFDEYGYMNDYDFIMERLVATIAGIYGDWSQGKLLGGERGTALYGAHNNYILEEDLIVASVALYEGAGGALSRASIIVGYDEPEPGNDSDLTELAFDIDFDIEGPAILAAMREDKLAELGL